MPKGEKRPADAIGAAALITQIATGEIEDAPANDGKKQGCRRAWAEGWLAGARKMSAVCRREIIRKAAAAR